MAFNDEIAARFEQIAQLLELTGADKFRAIAHERAARTIGDMTTDLEPIAQDLDALTKIDGIGKKIAEKIGEFAAEGTIGELEELKKEVPAGLLGVLEIPGLGPKTVRAMWQTLGVESVADLKKAIDDGSILEVPRMGKKTAENIKKSIVFAESSGERTPLGAAGPIAKGIVERLGKVKGAKEIVAAGSLRRGVETIGDIDILACGSDEDALREAFVSMEGVDEVLASGETKSSVRLKAEDASGRTRAIQVDLRLVPRDRFGAGLLYFTGSKQHNVRLRERAIKRKMTLNEYGLFEEETKGDAPPQSKGVKPAAAKTEADIYEALGLPFLPPELREDRGELELDETPDLVTVEAIRSELHAHTTASDGAMSIEELAEQAKARKFHTIAVTDHSQSQPIANGLSPERLREHIKAVRAAAEKTKGIAILTGSEVDILSDGRLDYEDELLAELDVVVASPHSGLSQSADKATKRLIRAIEHPLVHIIGHPTGRLINRRAGMSPDMAEVIAAAVEHDVALEINAHWMRLDLRDTHVRAAVEAGALIAIDCDVHAPSDFDNLAYGVQTGRRGWLTSERCVNTWTKAKLHKWLKAKR
ncbi:MAG: DNA polymerase/3'-5' exonuclease PolX [Phycisphaerales bacterium]